MEPRISSITIGVSDLERSVKFYRDGLQLPTNYKAGEGIAFFQLSGTWLALYPSDSLAEDALLPDCAGGFVRPVLRRERFDSIWKRITIKNTSSP